MQKQSLKNKLSIMVWRYRHATNKLHASCIGSLSANMTLLTILKCWTFL